MDLLVLSIPTEQLEPTVLLRSFSSWSFFYIILNNNCTNSIAKFKKTYHIRTVCWTRTKQTISYCPSRSHGENVLGWAHWVNANQSPEEAYYGWANSTAFLNGGAVFITSVEIMLILQQTKGIISYDKDKSNQIDW